MAVGGARRFPVGRERRQGKILQKSPGGIQRQLTMRQLVTKGLEVPDSKHFSGLCLYVNHGKAPHFFQPIVTFAIGEISSLVPALPNLRG